MRNAMFLSLGEAAQAVGKNKSTIFRAIKSGKISASKGEDGSYAIDPAELFRVYSAQRPAQTQHATQSEAHATHKDFPEISVENSVDYWRNMHVALEREKALHELSAERERRQLQATIDDLRARLDASETERRAAQARLEDHREKAAKRGGFLGFFRR